MFNEKNVVLIKKKDLNESKAWNRIKYVRKRNKIFFTLLLIMSDYFRFYFNFKYKKGHCMSLDTVSFCS